MIASKIRRVLICLLTPVFIYISLLIYYLSDNKLMEKVLKIGTPIGFLSLLGDHADMTTFVPMFGGPVSMLSAYHVLGLIILVLPRSLKQMVEKGIPRYTHPVSPLFLGINEVRTLSLVHTKPSPGYGNGADMCRCGIYLIFSRPFWARVLQIQVSRVRNCLDGKNKVIKVCFFMFIAPVYCVICLFEGCLCIINYGFPLCQFVRIVISGACVTFVDYNKTFNIISVPFVVRIILIKPLFAIGVLALFSMCLYFSYATGLIFIESFYFISEIAVFTFVSVIVFPNIAFGYLFFFLVILYYIGRLIFEFGDGYSKLLLDIVDVLTCLTKEVPDSDASVCVSYGVCVNVRSSIKQSAENQTVPQEDTRRLNKSADTYASTPRNRLSCQHPSEGSTHQRQSANARLVSRNSEYTSLLCSADESKTSNYASISTSTQSSRVPLQQILKLEDDYYAIPRPLFEFIVQRHKPVHQQLLMVILHIVLILTLIVLTLSIITNYVSGPTTEISEAMHILFIVIVGAIPRMLEFAFVSTSQNIRREIEMRKLRRSVEEFIETDWQYIRMQ